MPTQTNTTNRWKEGGTSPSGIFLSGRPAYADPDLAPSIRRQFILIVFLLLFCAGSYLLVSRYVVTAVVVQGRSMFPTLQDGDRCFLDRWTLNCRDPRRGDLVVIRDPGHDDYAVKRIVAMPGESLSLKMGRVYLNGEILDEPYLAPECETVSGGSQDQYVVVGVNHFFVLGDNRGYSEDSRYYGPVHRDSIIGLLSK